MPLGGALEGMVTGEVDETWAKEHHDLWYEEVKDKQASDLSAVETKQAISNNKNADQNAIWLTYVLSCLTPFTFLISGIIAILYAGYRLDKDQDGDVINSHYYGLIRNFFLFLTFFVVLIVTVATTNGVLAGIERYWLHNRLLDNIAYAIPIVGIIFGVIAIIVWFIRMYQGMQQLRQNKVLQIKLGPNL